MPKNKRFAFFTNKLPSFFVVYSERVKKPVIYTEEVKNGEKEILISRFMFNSCNAHGIGSVRKPQKQDKRIIFSE